jgi:hypothetical protein
MIHYINNERKLQMKYTDYSTPEMHDEFYCAQVSHHHYWFETYRELIDFMNSDKSDVRMRTSCPASYKST